MSEAPSANDIIHDTRELEKQAHRDIHMVMSTLAWEAIPFERQTGGNGKSEISMAATLLAMVYSADATAHCYASQSYLGKLARIKDGKTIRRSLGDLEEIKAIGIDRFKPKRLVYRLFPAIDFADYVHPEKPVVTNKFYREVWERTGDITTSANLLISLYLSLRADGKTGMIRHWCSGEVIADELGICRSTFAKSDLSEFARTISNGRKKGTVIQLTNHYQILPMGNSSTGSNSAIGNSSTQDEPMGNSSTPKPDSMGNSSTGSNSAIGNSSTQDEPMGNSSTPKPDSMGNSSTGSNSAIGNSSTQDEPMGNSSTPKPDSMGNSSTGSGVSMGNSSTGDSYVSTTVNKSINSYAGVRTEIDKVNLDLTHFENDDSEIDLQYPKGIEIKFEETDSEIDKENVELAYLEDENRHSDLSDEERIELAWKLLIEHENFKVPHPNKFTRWNAGPPIDDESRIRYEVLTKLEKLVDEQLLKTPNSELSFVNRKRKKLMRRAKRIAETQAKQSNASVDHKAKRPTKESEASEVTAPVADSFPVATIYENTQREMEKVNAERVAKREAEQSKPLATKPKALIEFERVSGKETGELQTKVLNNAKFAYFVTLMNKAGWKLNGEALNRRTVFAKWTTFNETVGASKLMEVQETVDHDEVESINAYTTSLVNNRSKVGTMDFDKLATQIVEPRTH